MRKAFFYYRLPAKSKCKDVTAVERHLEFEEDFGKYISRSLCGCQDIVPRQPGIMRLSILENRTTSTYACL